MKAQPKTSTLTLDGVKIVQGKTGAEYILPRTFSGFDFDSWMQRNKKDLRRIK